MAKVILTSSASSEDRPYAHDELNRMRASAAADKFGVHELTEEPSQADVILFIENCSTIEHLGEACRHSYYREFSEKCFLFSRYDHPLPFLPGVYASLEERWYNPSRVRSGGYLRAFEHDFISYEPPQASSEFLFSFIGKASTHPVRKKLLNIESPRSFLRDTDPFWPYGKLDDKTRTDIQTEYREVGHSSSFILCPRGRGTSSIRLFESLRMGRAPVIISDQWVPPEGLDWEGCSVRVAEKDVNEIPEILQRLEHQAREMGENARRAWEDWFSEEATFHRVIEWCLDIKVQQHQASTLHKLKLLPQLARPVHARAIARHAVGSLRKKLLN